MALPDRRPRAIDGGRGAPKSAVLAVTITISVLAAFALGVIVGRSQSGNTPVAALPDAPPANPAAADAAAAGPDIEMIRPDGSRADLAPAAISAAVSDVVVAAPQQPAAPQAIPVPEATATAKPAASGAPAKTSTAASPTTVAKKPSASQPKGIYTVQLAAFRDRESAERLSLTLESRGYDAYVQRSDVDGKGIWYRVRVGAFEDKEAARELAKRLETKEGRSAYVTIR